MVIDLTAVMMIENIDLIIGANDYWSTILCAYFIIQIGMYANDATGE
jgi:hypothetical protein